MKPFCPRCGTLMEESPYRVGRSSIACQSCGRLTRESDFKVVTDLGEELRAPADNSIGLSSGAHGGTAFEIPRVRASGVYWVAIVLTLFWTFPPVFSAVAAATSETVYTVLFTASALLFSVFPAAIVLGLIDSMGERQRIELDDEQIRITKLRSCFPRAYVIPLADVTSISLHPCRPHDPFAVGRYMFHRRPGAAGLTGIQVVLLKSTQGDIDLAEFLPIPEKLWLVWTLKAAAYKRTGKSI